jgi:hypothetical protein
MTHSRKRSLQQAFIVTIGAVLTVGAAPGCDGGHGETTHNPPSPCDDILAECNPPPPGYCPDVEPAHGSWCPEVGLECEYGDDYCDGMSAFCGPNGWETFYNSCNPPPPECPAVQPEVGTVCEPQIDTWGEYPSWCGYEVETPCGPQIGTLSCLMDDLGDVTWQIEQSTPQPSCNLPPELCHAYDDAALCGADPGCQWLAPGCADPGGEVTIPLGCYPIATDCATEGCGTWGSCLSGIHDPCYGAACDACGAEISVCLPNP